MTLSDIQHDNDLRHQEFPVTKDKIFLAHAAVCPLPNRVTIAMQEYLQRAASNDQESAFAPDRLHKVRADAAQFLGAAPAEVALLGPTSLALSFVAAGFPLSPGDNILIYADDYPSNVYPWLALADKGVEVRKLKLPALGRITPDAVENHLDDRTRLVSLASCHFITGYRIEVESIGALLRSRDIAFCVDGIQTIGAFPLPLDHVDFLAADSHKWLLGPCSAGLLFVSQRWLDRLKPRVFGWHNVRTQGYVAQDSIVHPSDARQYEAGSANLAGLVGLRAALELLSSFGVEKIADDLRRKRSWLVTALQSAGFVVLEPNAPPQNQSGILSFYRPQTNMNELHQKLAAASVSTSLRGDRSGQTYIRLSPHFYNTQEELEQLVALLQNTGSPG